MQNPGGLLCREQTIAPKPASRADQPLLHHQELRRGYWNPLPTIDELNQVLI